MPLKLQCMFGLKESACARLTEGQEVAICGSFDYAFAVHADGLSSTAIMLCVGRQSAPFLCRAKEHPSVALANVAREYYAVNALCLCCLSILCSLCANMYALPKEVQKNIIHLLINPARGEHLESHTYVPLMKRKPYWIRSCPTTSRSESGRIHGRPPHAAVL
jgi:hypothetical protein